MAFGSSSCCKHTSARWATWLRLLLLLTRQLLRQGRARRSQEGRAIIDARGHALPHALLRPRPSYARACDVILALPSLTLEELPLLALLLAELGDVNAQRVHRLQQRVQHIVCAARAAASAHQSRLPGRFQRSRGARRQLGRCLAVAVAEAVAEVVAASEAVAAVGLSKRLLELHRALRLQRRPRRRDGVAREDV